MEKLLAKLKSMLGIKGEVSEESVFELLDQVETAQGILEDTEENKDVHAESTTEETSSTEESADEDGKEEEVSAESETDVEAERYGYWLNERRNQLMVNKARELLSPSDQTLFFVKTAEHGLALRRLLPGVPLVHSGIGRKQWDWFCRLNLVKPEEYDSLAKVKPAQLQKDRL